MKPLPAICLCLSIAGIALSGALCADNPAAWRAFCFGISGIAAAFLIVELGLFKRRRKTAPYGRLRRPYRKTVTK